MAKIYKNIDIPKFLLDKRYLFGSVFFVLTFSVLFMLIYTPFSMTAWFTLTDTQGFGMTAAFYIVALAILLISKVGMYAVQNKMRFTYPRYVLWVVTEMLIISFFYTHFTFMYVPPVADENVFTIWLKAFGCLTLIIAIPYTIMTLYAAYKSKTEELEMLQYEMSLSAEPTVVYPQLVNLYDYNGTLKLTISSDSLYFMESQDNYVKIYYENQGRLLSYMLRCRTKTIEENLADTSMVRCHRSYMVNVSKINHIKKGGKARYIVLNNTEIKPIPVSKSYFKNLVEKIELFNSSVVSPAASGVVASGVVASGAVASGVVTSGVVASGAASADDGAATNPENA
ncbi:MAG: LytTR family transcriptional regulator [Alistipes sp.]|nr:LytTR family transcriptional regulator [Alistipes sp.]